MIDSITNDYQSNTSRSSKSRKTSYSSVLNDLNYNNSKQYHDKLSIKKFAKTYLWNSNNNKTSSESNGDSSKYETFSILQNMTRRYKNKSHDHTPDSSFWRTYFEKTHNELTSKEILKPSEPIDIPESKLYSSLSTSQVKSNTAESQILSESADIASMMTKFHIDDSILKNTKFTEEGKRVIQFKNFQHLIGINSLLSQVCGGPLEKVVLSGHNFREPTLDLWFLKSSDAYEFLNYSYSGLFLVNGFHIKANWAPHSEGCNIYHSKPDPKIEEEMIFKGASRCLILKKYINKKSANRKNYPAPLKNYSDDLKLDEMQQDLNKFGKILEISPVISKKLCIAIYFYETESSISAKREFDNKEGEFYEKYKDWTFWYGIDPCDRPCLNI